MKIHRLNRPILKVRNRLFGSYISRTVKRYARMEAKKALLLFAGRFALEVSQRPRIRLASKVILTLFVLFFLSNEISSYLKSKEPEIKVNGQQILVAQENELPQDEVELNASIVGKRSPFDFYLPVDGQISQSYRNYHRAYDIAAPNYSPIHPLGKGRVEFAGTMTDGKGNVVIVDHGDGLKSLYAHMSRINVSVGNQVDSDSVIGNIGLTGRTTGPHVHLEIIDGGVQINPGSVLPE